VWCPTGQHPEREKKSTLPPLGKKRRMHTTRKTPPSWRHQTTNGTSRFLEKGKERSTSGRGGTDHCQSGSVLSQQHKSTKQTRRTHRGKHKPVFDHKGAGASIEKKRALTVLKVRNAGASPPSVGRGGCASRRKREKRKRQRVRKEGVFFLDPHHICKAYPSIEKGNETGSLNESQMIV